MPASLLLRSLAGLLAPALLLAACTATAPEPAYTPPEASGLVAVRPFPGPDDVCQIIGENEPLPTHPKVEVVRELQALTSRKQLEEFAEDHGIGIPKAKGKSL